ncbi:MAG TPA: pentapeptide repeat-containing protein [Ktedonobacteraceae bacterium]|nr:pentapeptide repeat-containing protein [Ktedonobacteraceae bacterium]
MATNEEIPPLTRADVEQLRREVESSAMLDLSARNMGGINLSYFDLQGANPRDADLREANLRGGS